MTGELQSRLDTVSRELAQVTDSPEYDRLSAKEKAHLQEAYVHFLEFKFNGT